MFTGIIETVGKVVTVESNGNNRSFYIQSSISPDLKVDQSVSHNGICLTVEWLEKDVHKVTAIAETIHKTNISEWFADTLINLERSMLMNGRVDGHIVQGHVDTTAICTSILDKNGSHEYSFSYPGEFAPYLIEKGSISVNGISLTLFNLEQNKFSVAIIPYTFDHTNFSVLKEGTTVNIEFDMIGKYVVRMSQLRK